MRERGRLECERKRLRGRSRTFKMGVILGGVGGGGGGWSLLAHKI